MAPVIDFAHQERARSTAMDLNIGISKEDREQTADLLTQRMQVHEKNAWMLRSMLA